MDEFEKVIKELKKSDFVAELANGKIYSSKGYINEILLTKLKSDEEFFMDSMVGVKYLDKVGALLMVHANVCGAYAITITEEAIEIFEYFAVEVEYENKISNISANKVFNDKISDAYNKIIEWEEDVKEAEDPLEMFETLSKIFKKIL